MGDKTHQTHKKFDEDGENIHDGRGQIVTRITEALYQPCFNNGWGMETRI